jgi:hypothetical protein
MSAADKLAAQRKAQRPIRAQRYVSVEAHVSTYVDVEVSLSKVSTGDLLAELADRERQPGWNEQGDLEDGMAVYTLRTDELRAIRHLYLIGREVEASDAARRLIADMLGTVI